MRIVMNKYADGEQFAVETASDGSVVLRDLMGERKPGAVSPRMPRSPATTTREGWSVWKTRWSTCCKRFGDAADSPRMLETRRRPGQKHACETETEPLRRRKVLGAVVPHWAAASQLPVSSVGCEGEVCKIKK